MTDHAAELYNLFLYSTKAFVRITVLFVIGFWTSPLVGYAATPESTAKIEAVFAHDPDAWLIVSATVKDAPLDASEWMKAIGVPGSCGIACIDASSLVCSKQRDRDLQGETLNRARMQLSEDAYRDLVQFYDRQFREHLEKLKDAIYNNRLRLSVCDKLNAYIGSIRGSENLVGDPAVDLIKRSGHPKLVRYTTPPPKGLRRVFYGFGPKDGGSYILDSYKGLMEKKLNAVINFAETNHIPGIVGSGGSFLVRGKKEFDRAFASIGNASFDYTAVVSASAAAEAVKSRLLKWRVEILPKSATEQQILHVRAAAEAGDPNSQYSLAKLYETGLVSGQSTSNPPDYDLAISWYEKAASKGHIYAQTELGVFHYKGRGRLDANAVTAVSLFKKSAQQGDILAMYYLGLVYADGMFGVSYDFDEAEIWFLEASRLGGWYQDIGIAGSAEIAGKAEKSLKNLVREQIARNRAAQYQGSTQCDMLVGFSCNAGIDMLGTHIFMNIGKK